MSRTRIADFTYPAVYESGDPRSPDYEIDCRYVGGPGLWQLLGLAAYAALAILIMVTISQRGDAATDWDLWGAGIVLSVIGALFLHVTFRPRLHLIFDSHKAELRGAKRRPIDLRGIQGYSIDPPPHFRDDPELSRVLCVNAWHGPAGVNRIEIARVRNAWRTEQAYKIRAACEWCHDQALMQWEESESPGPALVMDKANRRPGEGPLDWPV